MEGLWLSSMPLSYSKLSLAVGDTFVSTYYPAARIQPQDLPQPDFGDPKAFPSLMPICFKASSLVIKLVVLI